MMIPTDTSLCFPLGIVYSLIMNSPISTGKQKGVAFTYCKTGRELHSKLKMGNQNISVGLWQLDSQRERISFVSNHIL